MEKRIQEGQWPVSAPTIIPTEEMHTEQGAKGAPPDEFMLSPPFTLLLPTIPSLCLPPYNPKKLLFFSLTEQHCSVPRVLVKQTLE